MPRRNRRRGGQGRGRGANQYRRDAQRDVMLTLRRELGDIRRTGQRAGRETRQAVTQSNNAYDALGAQLAGLDQPYQDTVSGIGADLSSQIAGLSPLMQQSSGAVPEAERAAGSGLVGTLGAGSLEQIASDRARNVAYNTSAQRQGGLERLTQQRNLRGELGDFREDLANRRLDLLSGVPAQVRQREDQLAQQAFDRRMALQAMALQQGQFGLQQSAFNLDASQQETMNRVWAKILNNPQALYAFLGLTGGP